MAKRATKKAAPKKSAAKRELIAPRGAKRYIRRAAAGRIKESRGRFTRCAGPRTPSGSTAFPALKSFAIRSPSGTYLKGMHKHGPDVHLAETAPADARHADR
jgi:hypothetical protein